jgi:hypothetical protein
MKHGVKTPVDCEKGILTSSWLWFIWRTQDSTQLHAIWYVIPKISASVNTRSVPAGKNSQTYSPGRNPRHCTIDADEHSSLTVDPNAKPEVRFRRSFDTFLVRGVPRLCKTRAPTHTHIHVFFVCMCVCMSVCMCVCMCVACVCMCVCMCVRSYLFLTFECTWTGPLLLDSIPHSRHVQYFLPGVKTAERCAAAHGCSETLHRRCRCTRQSDGRI